MGQAHKAACVRHLDDGHALALGIARHDRIPGRPVNLHGDDVEAGLLDGDQRAVPTIGDGNDQRPGLLARPR